MNPSQASACARSSPSTLLEQCICVCVKLPFQALIEQSKDAKVDRCSAIDDNDEDENVFMDFDEEVQSTDFKSKNLMQLKFGVFLPDSVSDALFEQIISKYPEDYLQIFADTSKCRLTKVDLSMGGVVRDQELIVKLFYHPLREVNLSGCHIAPATLRALKHCARTLRVLDLSSLEGVHKFSTVAELKNLAKLNLANCNLRFCKQYMAALGRLPKLSVLDLSGTSVDATALLELYPLGSTLTWLSLYNCNLLSDPELLIDSLVQWPNIVHLDLSKDPAPYQDEGTDLDSGHSPVVNGDVLEQISFMAHLTSLDISGSIGLSQKHLASFASPRPKLLFLGLYRTAISNGQQFAVKVTSEYTEGQILDALEVYVERPQFVANILRDLFNLTSIHVCHQVERALRLIMAPMKKYNDSGIHIAATASLYHLSRGDSGESWTPELKMEVITALLDSMECVPSVLQLQKNCCLTLCNFKIPAEVEFQYLRAAKLLLAVLSSHKDDYLRRVAVMLFNAIVCHNAGCHKKEIGQHGAIKIILLLIGEKYAANQSDALLDTCWSALWNITDETPENCRDFLDYEGMELFVSCLKRFPTSRELHRNMMGLMGNVAEVKELRGRLMTEDFVDLFINLLDSSEHGLEVSYNSAGVLAHMVSDGPQGWTVKRCTMDECMAYIEASIDQWDINSTRNINYRSFEPILRLLPCSGAPAAQYWASWALANLTKVYPEKYCALIEQEHGLPLLQYVMLSHVVPVKVKSLVSMVLLLLSQQRTVRQP